jgi:hypothetical protein
MTRIVLHIDELVLRGFDAAAGPQIGDAVRVEIERRLREQGVPAGWRQGGGVERLTTASVPIPAAAPLAGAAIGAAVHRSIAGGGGRDGQ